MKAGALRVMETLSQIVVCSENCEACRASAQALLESGVLELARCPLCSRPFAPDLGDCRCTSFEDGNPSAAAFHGEKRDPGDAISLPEYRRLAAERFRPLLAVMNPRRIPECMAAFEAVSVDKVWLRGFTERQLVEVVPGVVAEARRRGFSHLVVCSDDVVVSQRAVDAVLELLRAGDQVVTGFCALDASDPRVNLTSEPLRGPSPTVEAYSFWLRAQVEEWPERRGRSWFAGMCLTGMPLELWDAYPFACFGDPGYGSDFSLSVRLQMDGIPIVAARDGFVRHVKETWNRRDVADEKRLLVGEIAAEVVWSSFVPETRSESTVTLAGYAK